MSCDREEQDMFTLEIIARKVSIGLLTNTLTMI